MTPFQKHVQEILYTETAKVIEEQGYILESVFCNGICEKYGFRISTVRGTLRGIYPELSLVKRRLSGQLKGFYGLEVKGCPIMYMPDKHTGNC